MNEWEFSYRVATRCFTYNHAAYIEDALQGFAMQTVSFPIAYIIVDDASTDGEPEVIKKWAETNLEARNGILRWRSLPYGELCVSTLKNHPRHTFVFLLLSKNHYQSGNGPKRLEYISEWYEDAKYNALCEGDDYWTDPLKLQKQVDYMESHPECALCVHNAIERWEDNNKEDSLFSQLEERDYSGFDVCQKWILPTASFLFRSDCSQTYLDVLNRCKTKLTFGDTVLAVSCATKGTIHALKETMSVYRRNNSSFTLSHNPHQYYKTGESWEQFIELFGNEYIRAAIDQATYNYMMGLLYSLKNKDLKLAFSCFYKGILRHPIYGTKKIIALLQEKLSTR